MFITLASLLPPDSLVLLLLKYTILYLNKFRVKKKRGGGARENKKLFHETKTFSFGKKQFWKIDIRLLQFVFAILELSKVLIKKTIRIVFRIPIRIVFSLLPPDSLELLLLKYTILYLNKFRVKKKRGGGTQKIKKLFHETNTFSFEKKTILEKLN